MQGANNRAMSDKLKTGLLVALVIALATAWWIGRQAPERARMRTFKNILLQVDTAALQAFSITEPVGRGGKTIRFRRENTGWTAAQGEHRTPAFTRPLNELFAAIADIRPMAMPGAAPATMERYRLSDTLATRIDLPGSKTSLFIGTTTSGEDPATAVRLAGDPNAYLVPGTFAWITELGFTGWIPKPMVNGNPADWERLTFTFPGNISYALERTPAGWTTNGQPADSTKVAKYLHALSRYYGRDLANPVDTLHAQLIYQLRVDGRSRKDPVFLGIFNAGDHLIARSTLAPRWLVMTFDPQTELPRMFRPPEAFLPREAHP